MTAMTADSAVTAVKTNSADTAVAADISVTALSVATTFQGPRSYFESGGAD